MTHLRAESYHKICIPELSRDNGHDLHKTCYVDNIV